MRFVFILCLLCVSIPTFAQDTFKLRIENLKCQALAYSANGFQLNHDATQEPLTDLIKIKDNKEEFLMGLVPNTIQPLPNPGLVFGSKFFSPISLATFRFSRKEIASDEFLSALLFYTFNLTDGITTYPVVLVATIHPGNAYGVGGFYEIMLKTPDTEYRFPQQMVTHVVSLKSQSYAMSYDFLPFLATMYTQDTPEDRTLRNFRLSTTSRNRK